MSTRSYIGILRSDDSVNFIYCHHDGYPEGVGKTLVEYYSKESMIEALLDMGSLSSLGPDIGLSNDFNSPDPRFCLFYRRDRGEKDTGVNIASDEIEFLNNDGVDYHYLFDDGKWRCFDRGEEIDLYAELKQ